MENVSLLSNKLCVITHFFAGIWLFSSSTKHLYYPIFFLNGEIQSGFEYLPDWTIFEVPMGSD